MNKACETGEVREVWHEMAGCDHCGTCVRWDLQDHPVFGFQNCREKSPALNAGATPSEEHPAVDAHPLSSSGASR